jgi:glycosyltransferase involved in cell wall biosynthesis
MVSVVLPTHDRRRYLRLALASVLRQEDVELHVVVVDDGSSDGTAEWLEHRPDPRLTVVRHPTPCGVSAARNRGIAEARGGVVAFIDDDDVWAPDKLASQLHAMRADGRDWAYAGSVNLDAHDRVRGGSPPVAPDRFLELLPRWNPMPAGGSNAIVTRHSLERAGAFDDDLRIMADWDLWLRLARLGPPAAAPRPLVAYRIHDANMSLDTQRMLAELATMRGRYGPTIDRAGFIRYAATLARRTGRWREAERLTLRAAAAGGPRGLVVELPRDLGALLGDAAAAARRRLPGSSPAGAGRRRDQARRADPNRDWKAEAERWLAPLLAEVAAADGVD